MGYVETRNFQTSLEKLLKRWSQRVAGTLKKAEPVKAEVDRLRAKEELTPEDQKLLQRCESALEKLRKQVEKITMELELELRFLALPPEAAKSDLARIKQIVQGALAKIERGLPLAGGLRLKPDVDVDFDKQKFKKLGVELEWTF